MDPVRNPYSPGAGAKPAAFVGRDQELQAWDVSLERAERGTTDQPLVLHGLRGVGKTVLLSEMRRKSSRKDWIVAQVEAGVGQPLRELLGEALYEPLCDLARPSAGMRALRALKTALSFKASYDSTGTWRFGLDLSEASGGGADTGILHTDLRKLIKDLSAGASDEGAGLALFVDEAQDLVPDELASFCAIAHAAVQDDWTVLFAFAGLPSLPRIMSEAKSYTERFRYSSIEKLSTEYAADALEIPAHQAGAGWDDAAIDFVVQQSDKYPYYLQQFGQQTWEAAEDPPFSLSDAKMGVARGTNQLDNGFFRARWDRATRSEQEYLRAMADSGERPTPSSEVAARLSRASRSLGPARANLISKGLAYAPEHGYIAFTVPGMADFIRRQPIA